VEVDARAVGEQVVGRIRYTGAGRATGIEVETPEYGALYDFRAGRIRRVRQFTTYADALEAAGLSE
jgi:ketosteroid isomerase-like protein